MRSSVLESSLMFHESITTYKDSSPASSSNTESSLHFEENEMQQDTMVENYDPGEGPSSGNLQDKCSICDFVTYNRQEIIQHLIEHIKSRNNSSMDVINVALNQLRHFHNQENNHSTLSIDGQEDSGEEPGVLVPRINSQGRVKIFPCKNCDFKAMTKREYWSHIRVHIKPNKLMCCYKCPFVTEYKHHLEYHLLNHSGAKPYKCTACAYTCVNKSMLNSHMKSHSSVYQYRCQDCEYATKYCHTLKQHLRKYHHQPAAVLNVDGTPSSMVIDIYGTRRGPKQRPKNCNNASNQQPSTLTATTATGESSASASTATQTAVSSEGSSNSNDNSYVQQSTSTSTQALPSTSGSQSPAMPTTFPFGMFSTMFNGRKNNNLVVQKDEQTGQETIHYPFQFNHQLFTSSLNTATQQMLPNDSFVLGDTTTSTTMSNDEAERQSPENAEQKAIVTIPTANAADEPEFLEGSTAENPVMPLDLTLGTLKSKVSSHEPASCQQLPLNLANSPKVAGTRRRKGVAIKLEHRVVEKEEDTDEETTQSGKRLCQSTSPQAASAPSTSLTAASASSTSPQAATTPSTSFMTASSPSASLVAASAPTAPTAPSSPENSAHSVADRSADQKYEKTLTHNGLSDAADRYFCPYCNILFADRTVYVAHTRYHGNAEHPFTCNMCGTSYGNGQKFNLHIFEKKCMD